jgi:hypothetical protein
MVMRKTRVCCKKHDQKAPKAYSDKSDIISAFNTHVVIKFTDELLRKQQCGEQIGINSLIKLIFAQKLTPWNRVLLKKSKSQWAVMKFFAFYRILTLILDFYLHNSLPNRSIFSQVNFIRLEYILIFLYSAIGRFYVWQDKFMKPCVWFLSRPKCLQVY